MSRHRHVLIPTTKLAMPVCAAGEARRLRRALLAAALLTSCSETPLPPTPPPETYPPRPILPQPMMPDTPLGAPSDIDATAIDSLQIDVRWTDKSRAESGFRVQRATEIDGAWSVVGVAAPNAERFTDYGLPSEHRYCYRVVAFNESGESEPSHADCLVPPASPTDLTAAATGGPAIELAWTSHSPSATSYRIFRAVRPAAYAPFALSPTTHYRDTQVQFGKSYMYEVHAISDDGSSGASNPVTIALGQSAPAPATDVVAYAASFSVAITWQDHLVDESGSRVERSTDGATGWTTAATLLAGYTEAADTDSKVVNPEHRYCYRVVQFNSSGDGLPSDVACTTTIAPPTDLQAKVIAGDSIAFTWTDNSQIERGYQIMVGSLVGEGWVADLPANTQRAHLPMQPVFTNPMNVFYVVAYTDAGTSDPSNGIQFGTASGRVVAGPIAAASVRHPSRSATPKH